MTQVSRLWGRAWILEWSIFSDDERARRAVPLNELDVEVGFHMRASKSGRYI